MAWILHDVCLAMPPVDCERRLKRRLANPATGCVACSERIYVFVTMLKVALRNVRLAPEAATPLKFADLPSWSERLRCSRPPTRLSASPVRETGLTVLDQLAPGQLAQANIEHRRQEQAEQSNPDHAGEHGDAGS